LKRIRTFVITTVIGGLVVILPVSILVTVFTWLYRMITDWIQPLTNLLVAVSSMGEFFADVLVLALIVLFCFVLGLLLKTGVGRFVHRHLESKILSFAPGYKLIKETVLQFLGRKKSPFSSVALVQLYESRTLATAFITDDDDAEYATVFVPTGPNPTSGQIFHIEKKFVHPVAVGVEEAMRSIIACGAGSSTVLSKRPR
jgi:uncharacterized membrane protein